MSTVFPVPPSRGLRRFRRHRGGLVAPLGRVSYVRVDGHGHGGVGLVQGIPDGVFVAAAADQDAHGGDVGRAAQFVIDQGDVELELGGVMRGCA